MSSWDDLDYLITLILAPLALALVAGVVSLIVLAPIILPLIMSVGLICLLILIKDYF